MVLSETVIVVMITAISTFLALCVRYTLKSKCSDVNICFGGIHVIRDTEGEIREEIELGNPQSPSNRDNSPSQA